MNSPAPESAIGLLGLGLLGSALAERLLAGGFAAIGFDPDAKRTDDFRRAGGASAANAREVLTRADRVVLSLPSHREVSALLHDNLTAIRPGLTTIDEVVSITVGDAI